MKKKRGKRKRISLKNKKQKQKVLKTFVFALAILAILVSLLSIFIVSNNLRGNQGASATGSVGININKPATAQVGIEILPSEAQIQDNQKEENNGNL